jgi:hypothetical protein
MTPIAMKVLATGMRSTSARLTSEVAASWRMTPLPARITGHLAAEMRRAACSTLKSCGAGVKGLCTPIGRLSTCASAMFSGKSMKQQPGFSVCATLKALRTTSATMSGERIWVAYLVIGWKRFTRSRIWWLSLCMRVVAPCPAIATTGARSMLASATPVMRLVAPGPRVDRHTPALPVSRP